MSQQPAIRTEQLTKFYGRSKRPALDRLDLSVSQGEIFGYLGPNGAGKTTTIRLLLDLIRPGSGGATVLGLDAQKDSVELHRRIGFLPGELSLWENQSGKQIIRYLGRVRGNLDMAFVNQLAERLALDLTKTVRSLSSGNRRKLGLVIALMHKPDLLILDEPTNGLDPLMQQIFHQLMLEAKQEGRTVFLSSHILSEVQAICERVAILRDGQLKAVERVADLVHVNFRWITLRFRQPVPPERVAGIPGVSEVSATDNALKLRLVGDFDPVLRAVSDQYIVDVQTQEPGLEEIFLTYYGNGSTGKATPEFVKEVAR
jgi:ABC-2 type transport system ATP-binding protein